jgi:hypothetical protein
MAQLMNSVATVLSRSFRAGASSAEELAAELML